MSIAGMVETVMGPINLRDLGRVLAREHISCHMSFLYKQPLDDMPPHSGEFTLENLGYIRQYPYCNKRNLKFDGPDMHVPFLEDLNEFAKYGGKTILEASSYGCNRKMEELIRLADLTDLNIVVGTGFYNASAQGKEALNLNQEQIYTVMAQDLNDGCQDYPEIKAGYIGEIGCTWPLHEFEEKVIRAAGELSEYSKHGVSFRLPGNFNAPKRIMRLFQEAGGYSGKVMLCNVENAFKKNEDLISFARDHLCYCQFSTYLPPISYTRFPGNDEELYTINRALCIEEMLNDNLERHFMLSNNIHTRHHLTEFGGGGYSQVDRYVIPSLRERKLLSDAAEKQILIENPKRWLCTY